MKTFGLTCPVLRCWPILLPVGWAFYFAASATYLVFRIGSLKSLSLGVDAGGIGKQVALSPFVEPSSIFPNAGSKLAPFLRPFEVLSHLLSPDPAPSSAIMMGGSGDVAAYYDFVVRLTAMTKCGSSRLVPQVGSL